MKTVRNSNHPSIVIVEDDEDDIFILREGFDDLRYTSVCFYPDAKAAVTYLNSIDDSHLPALIVTDFNLPALNGFQFVQLLKSISRFSAIPVVVLTTSMSPINKKLFADKGVAKVIIKPNVFDSYKLVAGVLKELAEQRPFC
ncbi:MAG: response regulator [Bacteroidota bacterium]|nr:response regulator [Bacteroidota bacterium]